MQFVAREGNMEILNHDLSSKRTGQTHPVMKRTVMNDSEKNDSSGEIFHEMSENVRETTERVHHEIAKEQLILSGLENIRAYKTAKPGTEDYSRFIDDVIEKTQFEGEKVLESYRTTLIASGLEKSGSVIDSIVERVHGTLRALYTELDKNEISKQNAVSVFEGDRNPEEMIKAVIASLKSEKLPEFRLERERIIDLLGGS
jgi:hypothetical protein